MMKPVAEQLLHFLLQHISYEFTTLECPVMERDQYQCNKSMLTPSTLINIHISANKIEILPASEQMSGDLMQTGSSDIGSSNSPTTASRACDKCKVGRSRSVGWQEETDDYSQIYHSNVSCWWV